MYMISKDFIIRSFSDYVSNYDPADPKIKLKIDHTYRVADICEQIARSVGSDEPLAWAAGMLHDIGRFEQVKRYDTFMDSQSVDHAALGADLLFCEGLITRFIPDIDSERSRLLELAIRSHSALRLPESLNGREAALCNILRDADKVDGFRVNCDTPIEHIYNVSTKELRTAAVSADVKSCFERGETVPRQLRQGPADYLVSIVCWSFELEYPVSRRIAKEQGFLERLLSFDSDNPDTAAWFNYMRSIIQ